MFFSQVEPCVCFMYTLEYVTTLYC